MLENKELLEVQEHCGAEDEEMDVFCYVAYYGYLSANAA